MMTYKVENTELISENLSKDYKATLKRLRDKLIEEVGLTKDEANYFVGFYGALKKRNLFNKSFKQFDFPGYEHEGKMPNIGDVQAFLRDPELFYEIVLHLLNNDSILKKFELSINEETEEDLYDVTLTKDEVQKKKTTTDNRSINKKTDGPDELRKIKVMEDENYITYYLRSWDDNLANKLKNFFYNSWQGDKLFEEFINLHDKNKTLFLTRWCVLTGKGYFNSQKANSKDIWFFTFSKKHPIKIILDYMGKEATEENIELLFKEFHYKFGDTYQKPYENNLGETFLKQLGNRHNGNVGHHIWHNYHVNRMESQLNPPKAYNYNQIDIDSPSVYTEFKTDGIRLVKCYVDKKIVKIPHGIKVIEDGAFENLENLEHLILAPTTQFIEDYAFINCPNLKYIEAYHSLTGISPLAFNKIDSDVLRNKKFIVGVFYREGDEVIVKKPKNLVVYSKGDIATSNIKEESKRKKKKLKENKNRQYNIKKALSYVSEDNLYTVMNGKLYMYANPLAKGYPKELEVMEGVVEIVVNEKEEIGLPYNVEVLKLPKSFIKLNSAQFENNKNLKKVYMRNTNITQIPERCFANSKINYVELPEKLIHIFSKAFSGCTRLYELTIPESVYVIDKTAFDNSLIETLYTKNEDKLKEVIKDLTPNIKKYIYIEHDESAY